MGSASGPALLAARTSDLSGGARRASSFARSLFLVWPVALVGLLFTLIGRLGFQPLDDGNVLAQSYRILDGQVPHRDVIFARPMGSALFHLIDFLVPMSLFEASRVIGIGELVLYSLFLAWLVYDLSPSRWGPIRSLAAAGSILVNIHTFLLMGWYTTDGLLFGSIGFVALRRGMKTERRWITNLGLVSLGIAPLMKQSFVLVPLIGFAWVCWEGRRLPRGTSIRRAAVAGFFLALPLLSYAFALGILGGLDDFFRQIFNAEPVWGEKFVTAFADPRARGGLFVFEGVLLGSLIIGRMSRRLGSRARHRGRVGTAAIASIIDVACRLAIIGLVLWLVVHHRFSFGGYWALILAWSVVVMIAWRAAVERTFDGVGVVIGLLAWMTSLSWGYALPNLMAGSSALYLVDRMWRGFEVPRWEGASFRRVAVASTAVLLALGSGGVLAASFFAARFEKPYFDRPKRELAFGLKSFSPEWGAIRVNRNTHQYLDEMTTCLRRYPARWTAILPDNPGVYPALKLRNPFPIDWMFVNEVEGHRTRILEAAKRIDARGDYTILFQTFPIARLGQAGALGTSRHPRPYGAPLISELWITMQGSRFMCGHFLGIHASAAPASSPAE